MIEHKTPKRYRNRSVAALEVERKGKPTRYYLDGKRVTFAAFEAAKMWRSQDSFLTQTRNGITRHYSRIYWSESV